MGFDNQITGLAGEYFVAAELLKRNFQVAMTIGNAKAVDLNATHPISGKVYKIQVKTLRKKPNCFTLSTSKIGADILYFFVYLNTNDDEPDYHIVSGKKLKKDSKIFYGSSLGKKRETVNHGPLQSFKNNWQILK